MIILAILITSCSGTKIIVKKVPIDTPEKTIKLYYESINEFDRNKLAESYEFFYKEGPQDYYFGKEKGKCFKSYKIVKKIAYDKKTLKAESKKNNGDNWVKNNVKLGDAFITTSTTIKCNDGYLHTEQFYYWLRKFDGSWKIYSHTSDSDD
jgi:hypothetical protein